MLKEGFFDKVYYRFWQTEKNSNSVANVFAIHGLGGHCMWFDNAAKIFNENNINHFSFDLPGFGQSLFPRGEINSYKEWITVTRKVLETFLSEFEVNSPVFILGHSMGASISVLLSKNVKANGWIISVPGFEGNSETWPLKEFIIPALLKSVIKPKEEIIMPFGPELLTKNIDTRLKVKKDPLRVINPQAKLFMQVYLLSQMARRSYDFLSDPVFLLIAGKDKICANPAMEDFFEKIKIPDKKMKTYTDSFHDLFVEDELNEIVSDISIWIKERLT